MKFAIDCPLCRAEDIRTVPDTIYSSLSANQVYNVRCASGHEFRYVDHNLLFTTLYQVGVNALVDGYYREAVTSFSAALERFYEFFVTAICLKHSVDWPTLQASWRPLSRASERQLGAYVLSYLIDRGHPPALLRENPDVRFRNAVVHRGHLPTFEEAKNYGQVVLDLIEPELLHLITHDSDACDQAKGYFLLHTADLPNDGRPTWSGAGSTSNVLNLVDWTPQRDRTTLNDAIEDVLAHRRRYWFDGPMRPYPYATG